MGNKYYKRSADVERFIIKEWKGWLKITNTPGDGHRRAGSRGRFDVVLNAIVRGRQIVIGVQVKTGGTKPTGRTGESGLSKETGGSRSIG